MVTTAIGPAEVTLEGRVKDVGRNLANSLGRVLGAIPGAPHRPRGLAQRLGLNAVLTSRLLRAAQQHDPIAVAHIMPGPEPLRRMLDAAGKQHVDQKLIEDAIAAVDRFQQLIDVEAGDRSALDAVISGWLPGARERVELIAKQSVFRGVSHLLGTSCALAHYTVLIHPSARSADRADQLIIVNTRGLRRLRHGFIVNYDTVHADSQMLTVAGEPVHALDSVLLKEFCSKPLPQLQVMREGDTAQYTLAHQEVAVRSAVDLAHATYLPERREIWVRPGEAPRRAIIAMGINTPTKVFVFDVLVHNDIFPGQQPDLRISRTAGVFGTTPATRRDMDRLDVVETVQVLGQGLASFRCADAPAYQDMIQFVCQQRGWDPDELRGFRCRIDYPMYSSEIALGFNVVAR